MWASPTGKFSLCSACVRLVKWPRRRLYFTAAAAAAPALSSPTWSSTNPVYFNRNESGVAAGYSIQLDSDGVVHYLQNVRQDPIHALSFFNQLRTGGFVHDVYTYAAMIRILSFWNLDRELNSLLSELLIQMKVGQVKPNFEVFDLLEALPDCSDYSNVEILLKVWDVLVNVHAKLGMFDGARELLILAKKSGITRPCNLTCEFLMNRLIECGEVDSALAIYMELEDRIGLQLNHHIYGFIVKAFCEKGCLKEALDVLLEMEKCGMTPNAFTCSTYIQGLCKYHSSDSGHQALRCFLEAKVPVDEFAYSAVIRGLCRDGNLDAAVDLQEEMLSRGLRTNSVVVGLILQGCCQAGEFSKVVSLFRRYKNADVYLDKFCYNMVMKGFCKLGKVEVAAALLTKMKVNHVHPDVINYTTVFSGYCDEGKLDEAMKLFEEMKRNGITPDVVLYNVLASGLARLGFTQEVKYLLNYMKDSGIEPNNGTYSVIIEGLATGGKLEDAEAFLAALENPSLDIYCGMVNAYCSAKRVINMLLRAGEIRKALELFNEMKANGINPDVVTYTTIMNLYCSVDHLKEAVNLFHDMEAKGVEPDVITYSVLLKGELKEIRCKRSRNREINNSNAVVGPFLYGKLMDVEPDPVMYTVLIDARCKENDMKGAVKFFKEMIDRGLQPDATAYTALLCGYLHVGDAAAAGLVCRLMLENQIEPDGILESVLDRHGKFLLDRNCLQ
ncbi:unnamed protein product [Linum trigynum]|uniref:Pentatricopeptide repeat-containing protein n=1 Tax=Linum trigynum TaxID=586398 RepID=A0AAV2EJ91_9ROSI